MYPRVGDDQVSAGQVFWFSSADCNGHVSFSSSNGLAPVCSYDAWVGLQERAWNAALGSIWYAITSGAIWWLSEIARPDRFQKWWEETPLLVSKAYEYRLGNELGSFMNLPQLSTSQLWGISSNLTWIRKRVHTFLFLIMIPWMVHYSGEIKTPLTHNQGI